MQPALLHLGTPVLGRPASLYNNRGAPQLSVRLPVLRPQCSHNSRQQEEASTSAPGLDRRSLLLALTAAPVLARTFPAAAEGASLVPYEDANDNFTISVPSDWSKAKARQAGDPNHQGPAGVRRALAWYPEGAPNLDTNVTVVITNVGADYQSLGSFGTAEQFGMNLVASMDRSYLLRAPEWARPKDPIQLASLVSTKDLSGAYFVDYTVTKPGESQRRLQSVVAMGWNGRYNRLFTVTAQCPASQLPQVQSAFDSILKSFKAPPKWA